MRRLTTICLASTALIALPALGQAQSQTQTPGAQLQAQQPAQPAEQPQRQQAQQQQQQQDQQARDFLRQAAEGNMFGLESSRLAVEQAMRQDVRSFAQRMINDHEQLDEQLREAASGFDVPQELGQQIETQLAELEQLQDERFDRRYLSHQVRGHVDLVNLFQDYAQDGRNEQLRSFAEETYPRLNEHLNMAMDLQRQIVGGPQARAPQGDRQQVQMRERRMQDSQRGQQQAGQDWQRQRSGQRGQEQGQRWRQAQQGQQNQRWRAPGVEVTQQPPQVTVRQQQPQIIVRQSPPRITVDQPQPEIIVRMPEPQVDVATQRPEVDVRMPQPQVEVLRAQGEQVRVQSAERPQVQFEQTGEPEIEYRQAEGQPRIRYEQMGQQAQQQAQQQTWDEDRTTGAIPRQQTGQQQRAMRATLSLDELQGMDVANARGNDLGSVNDVLIDRSNQVFLVVAYGGFLGIGEREVMLPLNRFEFVGDQLVVRGMTDDQLRQQPQYRDQPGFRRADPNERVNIRQRQQAAGTWEAQ